MINTYQQAQSYLNSFIDYEKISFYPYKTSFKQERMKLLLKCLSLDISRLKAIHIAGTKGKGSTAYFSAWMLAGSGYSVGLYTSPHLIDFRERIKIVHSPQSVVRSKMITKRDVIKIINAIKPILDKVKLPKVLGRFSFFEIYTAIAFKYFLDSRVDFVVLETGLGGRLDATNIIKPLVSVITCIDYDHQDKLGVDLSSIAVQKCGIIKKNIPVVSSLQRATSLKVIKEKCRQMKTGLYLANRDFRATNIRLKKDCSLFDFEFKDCGLKNLRILPKGEYQVENASSALTALLLLKSRGFLESQLNFKKGLKKCFLEKRFEIVSHNPLILADIAHNKASFKALKMNLDIYFPGKKIILIFACSKDKDAKGMLKIINYSKLIITSFPNPRCQDPESIKEQLKESKAVIARNIDSAFLIASRFYDNEHVVVISGSLFLVSEAKKAKKLL